jgi:beta-lactamase class A
MHPMPLLIVVSKKTFADVFSQFDVPADTDTDSDTLSPKTFMRFFRILYNASYLWRGNSQRALEMLSNTEFKDGLAAGVPSGTTVAHKFGERTVNILNAQTQKSTVQKSELHDCGIVYYPESPYGICVMTEGSDFSHMKSAIADISRITYDAVKKGTLR